MTLLKKRRETMHELHSSVEFDNLLYHYKGSTKDKDFSMYNDTKKQRTKDISLRRAEENQTDLESNLSGIKIGGKKKQCTRKGNKKC